jgi:hypothetical protein
MNVMNVPWTQQKLTRQHVINIFKVYSKGCSDIVACLNYDEHCNCISCKEGYLPDITQENCIISLFYLKVVNQIPPYIALNFRLVAFHANNVKKELCEWMTN